MIEKGDGMQQRLDSNPVSLQRGQSLLYTKANLGVAKMEKA